MNILIPHNWLLEHLDTKATPEQIAQYLSLCGPSVESIKKINGESVYDIEVTTNRVDAMSIRGIAREAAAILPEFGIKTKLLPLKKGEIERGLSQSKLPKLNLTIKNDPNLCHRILAIKLENVQVSPSPDWLIKRLKQVNQRPLNNIIDITNYIMWEYGHPIHAFDYDRLSQKTIVVREAEKGEKFTTLDDKTCTTVGGEVIFDDGTGTIVDLPGIMGTKNTVVTEKTKNVLLWIEAIDAKKIRFASMTHALRSQAAILNEKHVDTKLGLTAIMAATKLYQKVAKAKVGSQLTDIYPNKPKIKPVTITQTQLDTYMGLHVPSKRITRILKNLGCHIKIQNKTSTSHPGGIRSGQPRATSYTVTPPSYRSRDIRIYQDIVEEVARIYGYHNLKSTIMDTTIPDNPIHEDLNLEYRIKTWLSGWGCHEIYTYSMISEKLAQESKYPLEDHLKIKNPLTDDLVYMRRSLVPSLIDVIDTNQRKNITVFEMQNVYHPSRKKANLPEEQLQLSIVTTKDYPHLKGILDALTTKLFVSNFTIASTNNSHDQLSPTASGTIQANGVKIGKIGKIDNKNLHGLVIHMSKLQSVSRKNPQYLPITNTPPIIEDLTFSIPPKTHVGPIIETIKKTNPLIQSVTLKDIYEPRATSHEPARRIGGPRANYTFTIIYRHPEKSLKDSDITPIRKKIVNTLKSDNIQLVGQI